MEWLDGKGERKRGVILVAIWKWPGSADFASNFDESDMGLKSGFPSDSPRCRRLPDHSKNVAVSFPRQHQSFCWVSWKAVGDCMRNANKSPKTPYSAMLREVEKWSRVGIRDRITTKT